MKNFSRLQRILLLLSMLMSGFCGIIAELSLFNLANSLIGGMNVVLTYTMGVMMFCMGIGALSVRLKIFSGSYPLLFTLVESLLSVLLGTAVPAIFLLSGWFPWLTPVWVVVYSAAIGCLIGLEIPVILLINDSLKQPLRENSAMVFFADYTGSLLAFILFSHVLLSSLGLSRSASLGALLNWVIACTAVVAFRREIARPAAAFSMVAVSGLAVLLLLTKSNVLTGYAEQLHYRDGILLRKQTAYQKIVLTDRRLPGNPVYDRARRDRPRKNLFYEQTETGNLVLRRFKSRTEKSDLRLFLNGGLQFSTLDEARYHEILVHPAASLTRQLKNVMVGGGGDGMALREILKHSEPEEVVVADLDPDITRLFQQEPLLCRLNDSAYHDSRVRVFNTDFFSLITRFRNKFDLIVLDFPDPHHNDLAKLYSRQVYERVKRALKPGGVMVTQSTSPFYHQKAFLIIAKTLESVFPGHTLPFKTPMPTFGLWSFHIASRNSDSTTMRSQLENFIPAVPTVYLNRDMLQAGLRWDKKAFAGLAQAPVNEWMKPVIVKAYNKRQ